MKQIVEVPDLEIVNNAYGDKLQIYVDETKVTFLASVDRTGSEFVIKKEKLKGLLG